MDWVFWLLIGAVVVGLAYLGRRHAGEERRRPVLPSHYDPGNYYVDPATIPGRCVHCETLNDPAYRFCGNCSEKLPETEYVPSKPRGSPSLERN